jgi:putative tricarboxylic transport membrane protein
VLLGLVGIDTVTGVERLTFGNFELSDGIELVPMLMGLFGLGEILYNLEQRGELSLASQRLGRLFPSAADWRASQGPIARGSVLGFFVGLIPGGGAILGSLLSYAVEKRVSKTPEEFGRGAIAGVAGPESANNAAASASLAPLLTLGIPGNAVTAVLFAGLLIQNVQPGPLMLTKHADVFWGVIASMYIGNVMLLVLNLPLVGIWVQLLRVPSWILGSAVLTVAIFGAYSLRNSGIDIAILMISGAAGYFFRKANFDCGPLVMAFVLANIVDTSLRQSLLMGDGDPAIFVTRPISATILLVGLAVVGSQFYSHWRRDRLALAAEAGRP